MLKAKLWKSKILGIYKRYHFILLESIKSVKNKQNKQKTKTKKGYQTLAEETS